MAIRRRSETIHLRTTPFVKSTLDVLSTLNEKTATLVIEELLLQSIENTMVPAPDFVQPSAVQNGKVNLKDLMEAIYSDNGPLFKIRLYLLVPKALSDDDLILCKTIMDDLQSDESMFHGDDKIFDADCGKVVRSKHLPGIDIERLSFSENVLKKYIEFRKKNRDIEMSYREYVYVIFLKNKENLEGY